ncbi:hypothetical protein BDY19DRAFT_982919 [Irpex rosettiformis]|uniref:Uncharacterized protein n=1 Tax=Irpex rosettiformis TaxID=378272 RepID=A0ACB8UFN5_9APHY|nr:hypothetical protein BDY19DRAFT_982919 [Irpex rosettiformis]
MTGKISESHRELTLGCIYIAGFAQAREPYVGLILPVNAEHECLLHIRIDRAVSPTWAYQFRRQQIKGDMFLTPLLRVFAGTFTLEQLCEAANTLFLAGNRAYARCDRFPNVMVSQFCS